MNSRQVATAIVKTPSSQGLVMAIHGAYILAKKAVPTTVPTIREVVRQIAMLGGFLGRKGDGEPGVKTLWQGMQRLRDFVEGMEHMRGLYDVK